jgi:predicted amidohydrolase YtcJ
MLIARASVRGRLCDVRIDAGVITEIAPRLGGAPDLDAEGGELLPGLHDHHVHLNALAAASLRAGPTFAADLRSGKPGAWVRMIGYHESIAGPLDRDSLDALVSDRPVRLQHRSGELWMLNGMAMELLGLEGDGRLWRRDDLLRGLGAPPSLAEVARQATAYGYTGLTNADPEPPRRSFGDLPQRVVVMGRDGPHKIILDDLTLPAPDDLAARIADAKGPVAIHCVTRVQLIVAVLALARLAPRRGDRIEHGSVIPGELLPELRRLRVTVVTQPHFPMERDYESEVAAEDLPLLYRCGSLLRAGIPVAAGSDAPFGGFDPWAAMRAAVRRREPERVTPLAALRLFLGSAGEPGRPRRVRAGEPADLCLLRAPLRDVLGTLSTDLVRATFTARGSGGGT